MTEYCLKIPEIVEVSPRDGIQNESKLLSLDTKIELIQRTIQSGAKRIEVASFVNANRVPQMANAKDVVARLPQGGARYIGLILNRRGFERAAGTSLNEVNFVVVASDTFNRRNQGADTFDTIGEWGEIAADARGRIAASVTVAAAFGCPFEGEVPVDRLLRVVDGVMRHDPAELALADTIGVGTPKDVTDRTAAIRTRFPDVPLRLHLHNTRNTGIANASAAVMAGVSALDASSRGRRGMPLCATRHRQYRNRGSCLHAEPRRDRHRNGSEYLYRNCGLARTAIGAYIAGHGDEGRRFPRKKP